MNNAVHKFPPSHHSSDIIDPIDDARRPSPEQAEDAVRTLISFLGDDPSREGLLDTPRRILSAYRELLSGYGVRPSGILNCTFSEIATYDDIVLVRDIAFCSHCEHHMMPIIGHAHVAYLPVDRVVGLSKIARLIDALARRLQTQERLSSQIVTEIDTALHPHGVAVMLEAEHLCMSLRGVAKGGSRTVTTQYSGRFSRDTDQQSRFIELVGRRHR